MLVVVALNMGEWHSFTRLPGLPRGASRASVGPTHRTEPTPTIPAVGEPAGKAFTRALCSGRFTVLVVAGDASVFLLSFILTVLTDVTVAVEFGAPAHHLGAPPGLCADYPPPAAPVLGRIAPPFARPDGSIVSPLNPRAGLLLSGIYLLSEMKDAMTVVPAHFVDENGMMSPVPALLPASFAAAAAARGPGEGAGGSDAWVPERAVALESDLHPGLHRLVLVRADTFL